MHFELNGEQQQLADAIRRWIGRDYGVETRRAIVHSESGVSPEAWAMMAELGLTALPVPEEHGGFGGDAVAMFAVMQELGRGLVVEPYVATMLGAEFLRLGGGQGALLERVAAGEAKLACALGEQRSRHDAFDIATRAEAVDGGFRLHGEKRVVLHGAEADALIVSARSAQGAVGLGGAANVGNGQGMDGVSLFVVPRDSTGLRVTGYRTLDGLRAANVALDGVVVGPDAVIGRVEEGGAILDAALDYGAGLLCAEALGAMQTLFDMTLEYLKTRQQFGAPIGKFQALQHRMADMAIHLEQARSMALLAALALARSRAGAGGRGADADAGNDADNETRRRVVSAAKYRVGLAARFIGQGAIQLHGGMGVTDELPASHYFKRLAMIELTLGDMDHHLERFMAQPGFREAA
ncbi:acyl-CoA dehydrogenase family protein [Massilia sp. CFBP9012]|uniref:acyl-CoA dehydrogenase family protein n=1 Tax=Massilia sp. CFBP9012 TaxID=3096531 RepID=UPI002A6B2863|nr:acyl-CoA dehydrogenase family protein [Massilia sp. CFBP9012]MDY0975043.1 acyl-CoA dehydrogenase family protein [Massilia sp. CFBP9012]